MINQIKDKNFLGNLTHIKRFSGVLLTKEESVSDHINKMNQLAFTVVPEINKRISKDNESNKTSFRVMGTQPLGIKPINLENVIYRISIHDLDECVTFDFPRPIKYHNEEITKAIYNTTQSILKKHLEQDFIDDINSAKDYQSREGYFVSLIDTLQVGLKMQQEIELGNKHFKSHLKNLIKILEERLSEIDTLNYDKIFIESMKEILNDYIAEFKDYI